MAQLLSDAQMASFEDQGYCTVDALAPGGLSEAELDAAEETWDRLIAGGVNGLSNSGPERPESLERQAGLAADKGFIELMCHPFFENIAKQVLRSEHVHVIELGPHERAGGAAEKPDAETAKQIWRDGCHIDFQVTSADFNATPRRDLLGIWFWVTDVPADRAAMRILPGALPFVLSREHKGLTPAARAGSHKPIMEHWDAVLTPEHRTSLQPPSTPFDPPSIPPRSPSTPFDLP